MAGLRFLNKSPFLDIEEITLSADQPKTSEEYARKLGLVRGVQPALAIEAAWDEGWNAAIHSAAEYLRGCGERHLAERLRNTYSKQAPGNE